MANELAKTVLKTGLVKTQDIYMDMITAQMADYSIPLDAYQKTCIMNAVSAIQNLLDKDNIKLGDPLVDQSSVTQALLTVAALKLNAMASPREVYFQTRNFKKKVDNAPDLWCKKIEIGVEGDGNDAILRHFGADIEFVGQYQVIYEKDTFAPPHYIGTKVEPYQYTPMGLSNVAMAVVYPIMKKGGIEQYHIAYRNGVKANLLSHISNNMMNETFGICVDRFKANDKQKDEIDAKKFELISATDSMDLDQILAEPSLQKWIGPLWRGHNKEAMIIRKMRNNIVKHIPKNFENQVTADGYEDHAEDEVKDIGGDEEPEAKVLDIEAPKPMVRPPKIHPQPQTKEEEPEVFKAADEAAQIELEPGF